MYRLLLLLPFLITVVSMLVLFLRFKKTGNKEILWDLDTISQTVLPLSIVFLVLFYLVSKICQ